MTTQSLRDEVSLWKNGSSSETCEDITSWDVSNIHNFEFLFCEKAVVDPWWAQNACPDEGTGSFFNEDLSSWNMSSAFSMDYMFAGASSFNANISTWDVGRVTSFRSTFEEAYQFNADISRWDVSAGEVLSRLLYNASSFNHALDEWTLSSIVNTGFMFYNNNMSDCNKKLTYTNLGQQDGTIGFLYEEWGELNVSAECFNTNIPESPPGEISSSDNQYVPLIVGLTISGVVLVIFAIGLSYGYSRVVKARIDQRQLEIEAIECGVAKDLELMKNAWKISWDVIGLDQKLASGAFGEVWKGTFVSVGTVAVKIMLDADASALNDKETQYLMRMRRHRRCVAFLGAGTVPKTHRVFLVLEFMDEGSLDTLLTKPPLAALSWHQRCLVLQDVSEGMSFLHDEVGSIHRDLKSANVMLSTERGVLRGKVGDYGMSTFLPRQAAKASSSPLREEDARQTATKSCELEDLQMTSLMTTRCGTVNWMSPEQIEHYRFPKFKYSSKIDIYAFGIVMWEVLERNVPWADVSFAYKIFKLVKGGDRPTISQSHRDVYGDEPPKGYLALMKRCWAQDPKDRPSFKTIFEEFLAFCAQAGGRKPQ